MLDISVMALELEDSLIFIPLFSYKIKPFKHIVQIIPSFTLVLSGKFMSSFESCLIYFDFIYWVYIAIIDML